jgi:hypothetical protein
MKYICSDWENAEHLSVKNARGNSVYSFMGYTFSFSLNIGRINKMLQIKFADLN